MVRIGGPLNWRAAAFLVSFAIGGLGGCAGGAARQAGPAKPALNHACLVDSGAPTPAPKEISVPIAEGVHVKLVRIEAGEFMMKRFDTRGGDAGESLPQRIQIVKPFFMGVHEVTQAQFEMVTGFNSSRVVNRDCPAERVSFLDALEFCKRLSLRTGRSFRLPTEAEWEYACRAGAATRFSFGDDARALDDYAWHGGNSGGAFQPVGTKKPNAWGLYDMYGNVWERCANWYDGKYYYGGEMRAVRGGGAQSPSGDCLLVELSDAKDYRADGRGFRVVMEAE